MPTAHIVSTGLTTIQDEGRTKFSHLGVPASGAWDRAAYRRIACLLGQPQMPILECLAGDLSIDLSETALCAWSGPTRVYVDERPLPNETVCLGTGRLSAQRIGPGPIYVGIAGLSVSAVLGSTSTDTHSGLGPRPLQSGNELSYASVDPAALQRVGAFARFSQERSRPLRFIPHDTELASWVSMTHWRVVSIARSGIRCVRAIPANTKPPSVPGSLPSYPAIAGVIQVPSAEEIIILGPDCGTTGGYATAGAIITADIAGVAFLEAGSRHSFVPALQELACKVKPNASPWIYEAISDISAEVLDVSVT